MVRFGYIQYGRQQLCPSESNLSPFSASRCPPSHSRPSSSYYFEPQVRHHQPPPRPSQQRPHLQLPRPRSPTALQASSHIRDRTTRPRVRSPAAVCSTGCGSRGRTGHKRGGRRRWSGRRCTRLRRASRLGVAVVRRTAVNLWGRATRGRQLCSGRLRRCDSDISL